MINKTYQNRTHVLNPFNPSQVELWRISTEVIYSSAFPPEDITMT